MRYAASPRDRGRFPGCPRFADRWEGTQPQALADRCASCGGRLGEAGAGSWEASDGFRFVAKMGPVHGSSWQLFLLMIRLIYVSLLLGIGWIDLNGLQATVSGWLGTIAAMVTND